MVLFGKIRNEFENDAIILKKTQSSSIMTQLIPLPLSLQDHYDQKGAPSP